ncbi:MAG: Fumarylacetoacetate hydrolase family protein [Myxococcaceae bacterium]|nr:Fumarylacetoacetate hydrolase family protein [Myxococcaceae bacterium]
MRLATLRDGSRDGALIVVLPDGQRYRPAGTVAPTLQAALDDWARCEPLLRALAGGEGDALPLDHARLHSPLPRAYEWIDGSAYLNHVRLVRKARGAEPPPTLETDPLVYQGGSGTFLGPRDAIPLVDPAWGLDFESEVAVVLGDTPMQTAARDASPYVRLVLLVNDVTLRNLIPDELAKGFGFFCSKPSTAFSPFALTPDELGDAWHGGRVHLRLKTELDGETVGDADAGSEMHFSFYDLIAHVTKSRALTAGTIVGSGTVSNVDPARGVSCLAERRTREVLDTGKAVTPFLVEGQVVRIAMADAAGRDLFGAIEQRVVRA